MFSAVKSFVAANCNSGCGFVSSILSSEAREYASLALGLRVACLPTTSSRSLLVDVIVTGGLGNGWHFDDDDDEAVGAALEVFVLVM